MNEDKQNYFKVIEGTTLYYEHYVKYLQKQLEAYENMRKEALEYIEEHSDKLKTIRVPKIDFNYEYLLNILNKVGENNR